MRWGKIFGTQILVLLLPASLAVPADDVEVIRSNKSVLSIYSYGGTARKIAPELPDRPNFGKRSTGALSDVVVTPELSLSPRLPASPPVTPAQSEVVPNQSATTVTGKQGTFRRTQSVASSELVASPPTVTLGWVASPDDSVAGYVLYSGTASHQYNLKQWLGNQTAASVILDQPTTYFAVSAYSNEGLESVLSDELVVIAGAASAQ